LMRLRGLLYPEQNRGKCIPGSEAGVKGPVYFGVVIFWKKGVIQVWGMNCFAHEKDPFIQKRSADPHFGYVLWFGIGLQKNPEPGILHRKIPGAINSIL